MVAERTLEKDAITAGLGSFDEGAIQTQVKFITHSAVAEALFY